MAKQKIYFGCDAENSTRTMFATVTGQMEDGSLVYTEIVQDSTGAVVIERGEPKLLLDKQYFRKLRYGCQTFHRI